MTSLPAIARRVEDVTATASIAARTLLSLDTNPVPGDWTHITKIDPEDEKQLPLLYPLYLQHTSAVEVGGSRDVTDQNTEETLDLVADRPVPAFQEPSGPTQVTDETRSKAEFLAIPEVLNGDVDALIGQLGAGIEHIQDDLAPEMIAEKLPISPGGAIEDRLSQFASAWMLREAVFEAYIIMNLDSAAARESNVTEDDLLDPGTAKQRALAAEQHLESELVYLEYSGTFGGEEAEDILEAVSDGLTWSRLWYGGGLDNRENAQRVLDAGADAVVVGNVFHEIADEEVDVCEQVVADLDPDASRDDVDAWIDSNVDLDAASATKYLSTIVDVSNPEGRAREYLETTILTWLAVQSVLEELDTDEPSSATEIRTAFREADLPGTTAVDAVLDAEGYLLDVLVDLAGPRYDVETDGLPVKHVSLEL
ncbi:heptaprenylglyceryl phosphate synthase [Halapricum salinum]|uniref:phosphoglycerol geranylgeranyltransferase n=1 Tax=Halapricum salinum TaxID=1457250 RepID=A0A4D6HGP0_9EURY|nr:heptaprenylglyceryl phosphate synthase [Halapricum salinum]QCC52765.1 heptaprenylglyceryl phosphate synthase [Halapricum salinum]